MTRGSSTLKYSDLETTTLLGHCQIMYISNDSRKQLWISKRPSWLVEELKRQEDKVVAEAKRELQRRTALPRWRSLFKSPDDWHDRRNNDLAPDRGPDFEHKAQGHELRLSDSTTTAWVKDQLSLMDLWRSFFDEPGHWSVERGWKENVGIWTWLIVHSQLSHQLDLEGAPDCNRKFWQWVEADRVKREVSPHID